MGARTSRERLDNKQVARWRRAEDARAVHVRCRRRQPILRKSVVPERSELAEVGLRSARPAARSPSAHAALAARGAAALGDERDGLVKVGAVVLGIGPALRRARPPRVGRAARGRVPRPAEERVVEPLGAGQHDQMMSQPRSFQRGSDNRDRANAPPSAPAQASCASSATSRADRREVPTERPLE